MSELNLNPLVTTSDIKKTCVYKLVNRSIDLLPVSYYAMAGGDDVVVEQKQNPRRFYVHIISASIDIALNYSATVLHFHNSSNNSILASEFFDQWFD